jgi:hypothetical protein
LLDLAECGRAAFGAAEAEADLHCSSAEPPGSAQKQFFP